VYFVARFDRPFSATGTWDGSVVTPGGTACTGAGCGAYVRFDTATQRAVEMKVGLSYVSTTGAAANLAAEDPGWSLATVAAAATRRWNQLLGRIRVGGGTAAHQRTFYTALYHSLLFPSVVSDANGSYRGGDGLIHRSSRTEYANFSEWDIYRSEIQLVSMLAPTQAGDMVQSLVNDAAQDGWLPKWAMPDGDLAQQNGDSADPLIASAYAFGVHSFNARAALQAMVKGATETESPHGLEIERQYLNQYLAQHYVDASALDLDSITYSAGASMTLEYALDDFSIAQLARALGQTAVSRQMMARAHNWEYLFNPATGYVQGRNADGSFPGGPAFNPALVEPGGTQGFEEGNAVQYTWTVPQDLASLAAFMGGDDRAGTTLTAFMAQLNAGRAAPYDWAGNEPSLWSPWEGDFFGDPGLTQSVVRQILTTLYGDGPVDEPGNDDLGALSSWYVWASLGLFPVTPGTANLALAAPLFPRAEVQLSGGRRLVIEAPAASTTARSIEGLRITGTALAVPVACGVGGSPVARAGGVWRAPWLPASILRTGGTLAYSVGPDPDPRWGAAADDRPPSYGTGGLPALGFSLPSGALPAQVGVGTPLVLGVASAGGGVSVRWTARASAGLTLSVASGTLQAGTGPAAPPGCGRPGSARQTVSVLAAAPGPGTISFTLRTAGGIALPPVVVDVEAAA
jgi:predicted alpha-1,2-mannosidase